MDSNYARHGGEAGYKAVIKENSADWYVENTDRKKSKNKLWCQNNKDRRNASWMKRFAAKKQRTPPWLTEQQWSDIDWFYETAADLNWLSEGGLHVDHIVPLQGEFVSGLHVSWNLQILPAPINEGKGNKFELKKVS